MSANYGSAVERVRSTATRRGAHASYAGDALPCGSRLNDRRTAYSLLELQVAFVVFGIALAGLGPLVVMHLKQLRKIEERTSDQTTYHLVPSPDPWARKLGAPAATETVDPGPPPAPPVTLIDNSDPGYSESGPDTWHDHTRPAINGSLRCIDTGSGSNMATWEFTGLTPGWYDVLATWSERSIQATDAPYSVYDDLEFEGTFPMNQQLDPTGAVFQGRPWDSLGVFALESTTLRVELSDYANNSRVVADAVRIVRLKNDVQILSLEKSLISEEMTVHVSVTVGTPP